VQSVTTSVGGTGVKTFSAIYTPSNENNYIIVSNILVTVTVFPAPGLGNITLSINDLGEGLFSESTFAIGGSQNAAERTISVLGSWDLIQFLVDGEQEGAGTAFRVKSSEYSTGTHWLTVRVRKGTIWWSKLISFTVAQ
jgi:hypothetical protein